jgi:hypothetical protein
VDGSRGGQGRSFGYGYTFPLYDINGWQIDSTTIPAQVKYAAMEAALLALGGTTLEPTLERGGRIKSIARVSGRCRKAITYAGRRVGARHLHRDRRLSARPGAVEQQRAIGAGVMAETFDYFETRDDADDDPRVRNGRHDPAPDGERDRVRPDPDPDRLRDPRRQNRIHLQADGTGTSWRPTNGG